MGYRSAVDEYQMQRVTHCTNSRKWSRAAGTLQDAVLINGGFLLSIHLCSANEFGLI